LDTEFSDLILKYCGRAGISLTRKQAQLLSLHIQLLLQWNTRLNLTRITAREEIIVNHLLDSILPAKFLPSSGNALDVGTGAGFPGIPLKIVYPDLGMLLLDSSRKKVSFLATAAASLGLKGLRAVHGRWQDFPQAQGCDQKLQLITMRAVRLEPEHITSLASKALAPGGLFAWWGDTGWDECAEFERKFPDCDRRTIEFLGAFGYPLPGIKRQRALWVWKKTGHALHGSGAYAPPPQVRQ
jgi:16S rRNA (guanine527-N7)-methyltransferase